jgi:hypothetical protein
MHGLDKTYTGKELEQYRKELEEFEAAARAASLAPQGTHTKAAGEDEEFKKVLAESAAHAAKIEKECEMLPEYAEMAKRHPGANLAFQRMSDDQKIESAKDAVNTKDSCGETALIRAVKNGSLEDIRRLLSNPAIDVDVEARSPSNYTALMHAISLNNIEAVEALLGAKADVKSRGPWLLYAAIRVGDLDMIKRLVNAGLDISSGQYGTAQYGMPHKGLTQAIRLGKYLMADYLAIQIAQQAKPFAGADLEAAQDADLESKAAELGMTVEAWQQMQASDKAEQAARKVAEERGEKELAQAMARSKLAPKYESLRARHPAYSDLLVYCAGQYSSNANWKGWIGFKSFADGTTEQHLVDAGVIGRDGSAMSENGMDQKPLPSAAAVAAPKVADFHQEGAGKMAMPVAAPIEAGAAPISQGGAGMVMPVDLSMDANVVPSAPPLAELPAGARMSMPEVVAGPVPSERELAGLGKDVDPIAAVAASTVATDHSVVVGIVVEKSEGVIVIQGNPIGSPVLRAVSAPALPVAPPPAYSEVWMLRT